MKMMMMMMIIIMIIISIKNSTWEITLDVPYTVDYRIAAIQYTLKTWFVLGMQFQ
jgi:hypothetical protein